MWRSGEAAFIVIRWRRQRNGVLPQEEEGGRGGGEGEEAGAVGVAFVL